MRSRKSFLIQAGVALLGAALNGAAAGQDTAAGKVHPSLQDKWNIQLGIFSARIDSSARLESKTTGAGTTVNLEEDLGLEDRKTLGTLLVNVRLSERWKIEVEYFSFNRGNSRALDRTIDWGGNTYPANTVVTSDFESDTYRLSGGYSFIRDREREFGIAFGLHATDVTTTLSAPGVATRRGETLTPLPTVGVYGAYAFSPRWLLSGRLDYFSLDYQDVDGSLVNFTMGVEYRVSRHFGIGAGYRHVDVDLSVSKAESIVSVNSKLSGPTLFAVASY